MQVDWQRFVEIVRAHQRFLLVSHIRPDCDALGSELGLAAVLEALGKSVRIVNGQATPPNLAFLDGEQRIKAIGVDVRPADLDDVEVIVILDTSAWIQLGPMAEVIRAHGAKKIVIDHHQGNDDLGAELFKDTTAEATGRLISDAAAHLSVALTPRMATPLFAALATDTGWFRFASTTPGTYRTAALLVEAGAQPPVIYRDLYEQDSLARLKLIGRTLARAQSELDGRLIHTRIMREDFEVTGALASDTEDVINMTLGVRGTEVAVIFVELPTRAFKISFRSRSAVDCSALARQFEGGGHKAAAGATIEGDIESVSRRVLDAVRKAMQ